MDGRAVAHPLVRREVVTAVFALVEDGDDVVPLLLEYPRWVADEQRHGVAQIVVVAHFVVELDFDFVEVGTDVDAVLGTTREAVVDGAVVRAVDDVDKALGLGLWSVVDAIAGWLGALIVVDDLVDVVVGTDFVDLGRGDGGWVHNLEVEHADATGVFVDGYGVVVDA